MGNLFAPILDPADSSAVAPRLLVGETTVDVRAAAGRLLDGGAMGGVHLLTTPDARDLIPAFVAIGAAGGTAAVGDGRWPPEIRARVEAALGTLSAAESSPRTSLDPAPTRPFYIGFTSGTTGLPKAYARSHASWIATMEAARDAFGLTGQDRVLALGPLVHSLALYAVIQALWLGGTALVDRPVAEATVVVGVPPLLSALARRGPHGGVRLVLSAGQALDPATERLLSRAFPGADVIDFYGTSEQSFIAWRRVGDGSPPGSVGKPFPGVRLSLSEPEGEPGRLRVASPMVFDGYLPGLDQGGFAREGEWTTVGDRGWIDAGGRLRLAGREGGMTVVRGVNVYPDEVEAALKALPGVIDAGVLGLSDPRRGALLVALVEGTRAPAPSELTTSRPEKRPRRILLVPALPRTLTGKLDRAALAEMAARLMG